ncbi:MAG TPA: hypothetical protein VF408_02090 [Sediminibacterium sp.]|jgi:protein TonB
MKKYIPVLLIVCIVSASSLSAQTGTDSAVAIQHVEKKPEFKKGINGWLRFLENNLDRNLMAKSGAPSGKYRVLGSFIVETDGSVKDILIEEDPGYGTADEYKRIIRLSSKQWIPASDKGVAVAYRTKQSLTFVNP